MQGGAMENDGMENDRMENDGMENDRMENDRMENDRIIDGMEGMDGWRIGDVVDCMWGAEVLKGGRGGDKDWYCYRLVERD